LSTYLKNLNLGWVACGKKGDEATTKPSKETISAPPPTPIDQTTVGEVIGKISFEGVRPKPQRINMDQDPACEQKHRGPVIAEDGAVNDDGTLCNAFVYVKAGAEKYAFAPPADPVVLNQDGCMYKPHVLGFGTREQKVTVGAKETKTVDFKFKAS